MVPVYSWDELCPNWERGVESCMGCQKVQPIYVWQTIITRHQPLTSIFSPEKGILALLCNAVHLILDAFFWGAGGRHQYKIEYCMPCSKVSTWRRRTIGCVLHKSHWKPPSDSRHDEKWNPTWQGPFITVWSCTEWLNYQASPCWLNFILDKLDLN